MKKTSDVNDNYEHYLNLRDKYPKFIYHNYDIEIKENNYIEITYHFEIEKLACFHPRWLFRLCDNKNILEMAAFKNAVFYLGLVEQVSYFKLTCPKKILVKCKKLSDEEIKWWKKLYFNGLSEFYYRNNILQSDSNLNFENMTDIISENSNNLNLNTKFDEIQLSENCLIPIGGGKDSAVTLELLRNEFNDNFCYIINERGATIDTAIRYGFSNEQIYIARRFLDEKMLKLNNEGFLNGHTPFSAIVAFSATIAAMLCNKKYIVLSNEASANESTVLDVNVNHQYSKSFEFEKDFYNYEKKYIKSNTHYFSLLRPLCELQIARIFSDKCKKYFDIFKSCNVGSKKNIWCCKCPKCLFTYLILSPFLENNNMQNIFKKDLSTDVQLLDDFKRLIGLEKEKPFECVGSIDEVNAAIYLKIKKSKNNSFNLPYLYKYYKDTKLNTKININKYMNFFNEENGLPYRFLKIVEKYKTCLNDLIGDIK